MSTVIHGWNGNAPRRGWWARASGEAKPSDKVPGGKADKLTAEDIARKHKVSVGDIRAQLAKGVKVELEHTNDKKLAEEIALDHLTEFPYYYNMLEYMEGAAEGALDDGLPDELCPYAYRMAKEFIESTKDDWNYITPEEYEKMPAREKASLFLLDIRKPEDFKEGHIPGATNIFWLDLFTAKNLAKLPLKKKILVYCYVGHTSSQALVLLKMLGFDVAGLKFGMGRSPVKGVPVAGWLDFGFKTAAGQKRCPRCGSPLVSHPDRTGHKGVLQCPRCFLNYSPEAQSGQSADFDPGTGNVRTGPTETIFPGSGRTAQAGSVDNNTIFVGKVLSIGAAKKLCEERHGKLPGSGYESLIDSGTVTLPEAHVPSRYKTYLVNGAGGLRVRTWLGGEGL